jgi:hypothetical protein
MHKLVSLWLTFRTYRRRWAVGRFHIPLLRCAISVLMSARISTAATLTRSCFCALLERGRAAVSLAKDTEFIVS